MQEHSLGEYDHKRVGTQTPWLTWMKGRAAVECEFRSTVVSATKSQFSGLEKTYLLETVKDEFRAIESGNTYESVRAIIPGELYSQVMQDGKPVISYVTPVLEDDLEALTVAISRSPLGFVSSQIASGDGEVMYTLRPSLSARSQCYANETWVRKLPDGTTARIPPPHVGEPEPFENFMYDAARGLTIDEKDLPDELKSFDNFLDSLENGGSEE